MKTASATPYPWASAALAAISAVLAAVFAAIITGGSADPWYAALNKPAFTPPDIVFAIVWPYLFATMIVGTLLVLNRSRRPRQYSGMMGTYYLMLAVGICWNLFFFGFHETGYAFGIIAALWLSVLTLIVAYWRVSPLAALLQLPHLVWITFAGVLNAAVWVANRAP